MNQLFRIELYNHHQTDRLESLCTELAPSYPQLERITPVRFYKIGCQQKERLQTILWDKHSPLLHDPVIEEINWSENRPELLGGEPTVIVETSPKPGVTDNPGHVICEALELLKLPANAASGTLYLFYGKITPQNSLLIVQQHLANALIHQITAWEYQEYLALDRFQKVEMPNAGTLHQFKPYLEINLDCTDQELEELSQKRCLALNIDELHFIQSYYRQAEVRQKRQKANLPLNPTDVELEILAQTWSEHCKHKIFGARITFNQNGNTRVIEDGLYRGQIKRVTKELINDGLDWAISVFSDNAGIVRFDPNVDLSIKVETHNSPSALDPYGGAITGILGVNRDILGCGMGHRPIANTDIFCFASPNCSQLNDLNNTPLGLRPPRQVMEGVHRGVVDGGNKSGIPTVNGALFFNDSYAGKPLVFCGTVGVAPQEVDGKPTAIKRVATGDLIYMVGGAIGADGIHGATMSSLELSADSPTSAVQIGDPLTQKRVSDFIINARDFDLFSGLTDNGAGGLSSSIGEMATLTGGATIDLSLAPTKYPGLTPYELMISESQERMSVAVTPEQASKFEALATQHGVSATKLGSFDTSGSLNVLFNRRLVASLPLSLMHDSLPQMELTARWDGPVNWPAHPYRQKMITQLKYFDLRMVPATLLALLGRENIASKERVIRQYDHEVQGATHRKPLEGSEHPSPNDSAIIWLYPHGGEKDSAISIGCGLAPRISPLDPHLMAIYAADEAVRNVIAHGGDIDHCALLDNFCWPDPVVSAKNPDGDQKLAMLVMACEGLYHLCKEYRTPLVSGKDSMKNDFRGQLEDGSPITISVLPTLLVSAMAKSSVSHTSSSPFKQADDLIYLLSSQLVKRATTGLAASEFSQVYSLDDPAMEQLSTVDLSANRHLYRKIFTAHQEQLLASCHDISDGGLACALAEKLFTNQLGASITVNNCSDNDLALLLFNEAPGQFVVSVAPKNQKEFEQLFTDNYQQLGTVTNLSTLTIKRGGEEVSVTTQKLQSAWDGGL